MKKATLQFSDIPYIYLFDANAEKERYFAFKNKYGYSWGEEERQKFLREVKSLTSELGYYDLVIVPQSQTAFLSEVAAVLGRETLVIKKNTLPALTELLSNQAFMKSEKVKLLAALDAMALGSGQFQIHNVAGNQRKRFTQILFEAVDAQVQERFSQKKVLVLDDSVFSGYTLQALEYQVKKAFSSFDTLVLFSKQAQLPQNQI